MSTKLSILVRRGCVRVPCFIQLCSKCAQLTGAVVRRWQNVSFSPSVCECVCVVYLSHSCLYHSPGRVTSSSHSSVTSQHGRRRNAGVENCQPPLPWRRRVRVTWQHVRVVGGAWVLGRLDGFPAVWRQHDIMFQRDVTRRRQLNLPVHRLAGQSRLILR